MKIVSLLLFSMEKMLMKSKLEEFISELEEKYEDFDIQCYKGNQPLYYFIMSVE